MLAGWKGRWTNTTAVGECSRGGVGFAQWLGRRNAAGWKGAVHCRPPQPPQTPQTFLSTSSLPTACITRQNTGFCPSRSTTHSSRISLIPSDSDSAPSIPHLHSLSGVSDPLPRRRTASGKLEIPHPSLAAVGGWHGHVPNMAAPEHPETSRR